MLLNSIDWKKFFKPQLSKIILLVLLVLIFGAPATGRHCPGMIWNPDKIPSCIERFEFATLFEVISGGMMWDAHILYSFNFILVSLYLIFGYSVLSLLFYLTNYSWKKSYLFAFIFLLLLFFLFLIYSLYSAQIISLSVQETPKFNQQPELIELVCGPHKKMIKVYSNDPVDALARTIREKLSEALMYYIYTYHGDITCADKNNNTIVKCERVLGAQFEINCNWL